MIKIYKEEYSDIWDQFVLTKSLNGNILHTRLFLEYHPASRFIDHSIMFFKGSELVAVLPANVSKDGKRLISHEGSTYGGIIIKENYDTTVNYKWIFSELMEHIYAEGFSRVEIRTSSWLYKRKNKCNELLEYFYQLNGFYNQKEIGFYIDLNKIDDNYEKDFDSLKRRKLKKAYGNELIMVELNCEKDIKAFYDVLSDNMTKFNTKPVHTYQEICDLKFVRLKEYIRVFGVYYKDKMVAGSLVFDFCEKKVFHTQYLCSRRDSLELCPNEFLYTKLIETARADGYRYISFGTASLEHGKIYNESLGIYKEGYNTDSYVNTTFIFVRGDIE